MTAWKVHLVLAVAALSGCVDVSSPSGVDDPTEAAPAHAEVGPAAAQSEASPVEAEEANVTEPMPPSAQPPARRILEVDERLSMDLDVKACLLHACPEAGIGWTTAGAWVDIGNASWITVDLALERMNEDVTAWRIEVEAYGHNKTRGQVTQVLWDEGLLLADPLRLEGGLAGWAGIDGLAVHVKVSPLGDHNGSAVVVGQDLWLHGTVVAHA